jgi:HEAT repeat protein
MVINQIEYTLDELIKILKNGNWEERRDAAEVLGNLGNRQAVQPLIETVSNHFGDDYGHPNYKALQDWMVREQAAKALGKLGDEQVLLRTGLGMCGRRLLEQ